LLKRRKSFDRIAQEIKPNKSGDRVDGNDDFSIVAKDSGAQSYEWTKEHIFE
jgi:hypothetical protein